MRLIWMTKVCSLHWSSYHMTTFSMLDCSYVFCRCRPRAYRVLWLAELLWRADPAVSGHVSEDVVAGNNTLILACHVSPRVCCSAPPGCTSCPATPTSSPPSARCLSSATLTPPHTSRRQSRWVSPGPRERYPDYNEGSPYSDFQRKILVIVHNFIFCA